MKRTFAVILAMTFILSLCACGATPPDPKELYAKAEELLGTATALDYSYDSDMTVKAEAQGLTIDMTMGGECKYAGRDTAALTCSAETRMSVMGTETKSSIYYKDGFFYQSGDAGNFKTPMEAGGFFEYLVEEMGLKSDAEYITEYSLIENADDTYSIGFTGSGEAMSETITEVSGGMGMEIDAEDVVVTGSMLVSKEGVPSGQTLHMELSTASGGTPMSMTMDMTMTFNSINGGDVVPDAPSAEGDYIEVCDVKLPGYLTNAYATLAAEQALAFDNTTEMTFAVDGVTDIYKEELSCAYSTGDSLRFKLDDDMSFNDVTTSSSETYSNGTLTGVYDGAENTQTGLDDATMLSVLAPMYSVFAPTWDAVENVTMESGDVITIEFDYMDEYITSVINSYYASLSGVADLSTYASAVTVNGAHGVMTLDAVSGALLTHTVTASAAYVLDGVTMDITLEFDQTIIARGAEVTL